MDKVLAQTIHYELLEVSKAFGDFQKKINLLCPSGCGKCCFKPDISCTPYELLPLAFYLLEKNLAQDYLELAQLKANERCLLLEVTDEAEGLGFCGQYHFRPFICRAFGVAARHTKNEQIEYSLCKTLKENSDFPNVANQNFLDNEIPYIETWKKRLETIDPRLTEKEIPINQALALILEKILLWDSFQEKT